jgi:uncharacterized protein YndB with AHSA1/START domain
MAVKFDQHVDIDAPADTVWATIIDSATWPQWLPDVEQVTNVSAVEPGGTFQFQGGGESGSGSITLVDAASYRLKIVIQSGAVPETHTFDVDRSGGFLGLGGNDARLKYTLEYDPPGGFLSDFVAGGNPKDMLKVKHTLDKIKDLAERRA